MEQSKSNIDSIELDLPAEVLEGIEAIHVIRPNPSFLGCYLIDHRFPGSHDSVAKYAAGTGVVSAGRRSLTATSDLDRKIAFEQS
jgi:hypothetical protein